MCCLLARCKVHVCHTVSVTQGDRNSDAAFLKGGFPVKSKPSHDHTPEVFYLLTTQGSCLQSFGLCEGRGIGSFDLLCMIRLGPLVSCLGYPTNLRQRGWSYVPDHEVVLIVV
ncbi:unnamed protein product [Ectocarpus fasciculatus]